MIRRLIPARRINLAKKGAGPDRPPDENGAILRDVLGDVGRRGAVVRLPAGTYTAPGDLPPKVDLRGARSRRDYIKQSSRRFAIEWFVIFLLCLVGFFFGLKAVASANPYPHGQELSIKAGGYPSTVRGYADGSAETFARLFWNGVWHEWRSCRRSTYSVHLWVCEGFGVTPGRSAFAQVVYRNSNGDSYGYTPWVWSSCCSTNSAVSGVLG